MFDFGILSSILLGILLTACGGFSGWRLRAAMRDGGLELRAQAADITWLRAALTDSEKRCAQQAEWLSALEEELVILRPENNDADQKRAQNTTQGRSDSDELAAQ